MPKLNEPDFENIKQQTIECLEAKVQALNKLRGSESPPKAALVVTEDMRTGAVEKITSIWEKVNWTHIVEINEACFFAAEWGIEHPSKTKKRPGPKPKTIVSVNEEKVRETLGAAFVDKSVKVE